MRKISLFVALFVIFVGLCGCDIAGLADGVVTDGNVVYQDVDNEAMLAYLKENITNQSGVDEIIDVFEKLCEEPIRDEMLLLEYGVYDFSGEDVFYFDIVRQYPDGEDEFYQLRVSLVFAPDRENARLQDTIWGVGSAEDFFQDIQKSAGYEYVANHEFQAIEIYLDQT